MKVFNCFDATMARHDHVMLFELKAVSTVNTGKHNITERETIARPTNSDGL